MRSDPGKDGDREGAHRPETARIGHRSIPFWLGAEHTSIRRDSCTRSAEGILHSMRAPVPVILNRSSGSARDPDAPDRVRESFRAAEREADIQVAASGEEVITLARRAASGASDIVV